jgi:hypothetical protein
MNSGSDATDRLLKRVAERARSSADPVERVRISASLQWYGGRALRFAVEECPEEGLSWPVLGNRLGDQQTTRFPTRSMITLAAISVSDVRERTTDLGRRRRSRRRATGPATAPLLVLIRGRDPASRLSRRS